MKELSLFPTSATVLSNGHLSIAGYDLETLADEYGTPLYLYDAATISGKVDQLRALIAEYYAGPSKIAYAAKAYFSARFAKHLVPLCPDLDLVSLGELAIAIREGFAPSCLHLHGNNKSEGELQSAIELGLQAVVIDSLDELEFLECLASQSGKHVKAWLRIAPDLDVQTHPHIQTGSADSKFGLHLLNGQAEAALRKAMTSNWIKLTGLHFHLGSQLAETLPYIEAIQKTYQLAAKVGFVPLEFSPGGGWGERYREEDDQPEPGSWVSACSQAIQEACGNLGWALPRLVLEPGRWLVARAGVAVYTVGNQKETAQGTRIIALDGGMADNPRPALYQAAYTACLAKSPLEAGSSPARLVGRYCESGDVLIQEVTLPDVRRGERVVIPVAGAYQLSMASNYNLTGRPAVLLLEPDKLEVIQEREDPANIRWWSIPE